MRSKRFLQTMVLGVLILSTAACSSGLNATEAANPKDLIEREVVLSEYKIEPDHIKVSVNAPVRFTVKNEGQFTHEFRVLVDPVQVIEVPPLSKDRMDVVFDKPGEYEYVCNINGHERLGMKGTLTVEAVE